MKRKHFYIQQLIEKVDSLEKKIESLPPKGDTERWLDNDEACEFLHVSKRTLQNYRDEGIIPFSQFRDKILYKYSDLQKHLEKHYKTAFSNK